MPQDNASPVSPQAVFGILLVLLMLLGASLTFYFAGESPGNILQTRYQQISYTVSDYKASIFGDTYNRTAVEREIHRLVNKERARAGVDTISFDTDLHEISRYHSLQMARNGFIGHKNPQTGTVFQDRYQAFNYTCQIALDDQLAVGGENIAQTFWRKQTVVDGETFYHQSNDGLAEGIFSQWNASQEHRENMLRPYWNNQGIGIARSESKIYVTQNFC